ncbi:MULTISPECIES: immunoglobulin-like domain-containing protein [Bacillaceae]
MEYSTGTQVFLEKKIEDVWYNVPMKAESFTEEAIIHPQ